MDRQLIGFDALGEVAAIPIDTTEKLILVDVGVDGALCDGSAIFDA